MDGGGPAVVAWCMRDPLLGFSLSFAGLGLATDRVSRRRSRACRVLSLPPPVFSMSRRLAFWSAMSLLDCIIAICKESNDRQQHPIGHIALLFEFEITIHRFIIHTRQEHSATIVSSTTPLAYLPEPNNKTADTVFFFLHKKWKKRSFCPTAKAYVSIQNQPITTQAKVGRKEWPAPCR